MKRLILIAAILLSGCAANSGVVPIGQNTYMVSIQAATGLSGLGNLKADAINQAYQYCQEKGKDMNIIETKESKPPFVLGNYPKVEIQFKCGEKNNP